MDEILIEKVDNTYLRLNCNETQALNLYSYFECYAPQYAFHPRYKAGIWNGKIGFFNLNDLTLPIGLLYKLKDFLQKYSYKCVFMFDKKEFYNDMPDEEMKNFYDALYSNSKYYPRDYQERSISTAIRKKRGVVEAATGCHSKGTKVVMFDGSVKNVEDVDVGDRLMGPDNKPRNVLRLFGGTEMMYKITPNKGGSSFIVNENHILHLGFTGGSRNAERLNSNSIDISVKEYLKQNLTFKHEAKLVFNDCEIDFGSTGADTKLDSYFIGLYLGDGHTYTNSITTMDHEVVDVIYEVSEQFGTNITMKNNGSKANTYNFVRSHGQQNPINAEFEKLGLNFGLRKNWDRTTCSTKFIPDQIKRGTVNERYGVLAGLIDSDGYLANGTYYEFASKSESLRDDLTFVARSLGYFVSIATKVVKGCRYYRATIQGDIDKIPCKIERKREIRSLKNKRHNIHGFKVESCGIGDYFGFMLDSDHLYFTDDFMIHHNSGKSMIIYSLIRYILATTEGDVLLVVPNISLTNQMFSDFNDYGWTHAQDHVGILYSGQKYDPSKRVLISTWQSIFRKQADFFQRFTGVLVDETHGAKSASIQGVLKKCVNADYRIGLTGTLPSEPADICNIYGYLGPKIVSIRSKELIDKGHLSKIKIANMLLQYPESERKLNRKRNFSEEYRAIIQNPYRNKVLKHIIKNINTSDNVLILAERIEHLDAIYEYLNVEFLSNVSDLKVGKITKPIYMVHGKTPPLEREKIRNAMDSEEGAILVASYGTTSTGVNMKRIHHVIFASSYKAEIKVLQSIGRGLRLHESKKGMVLWDLVDDMTWKKRTGAIGENYVFQHYKKRLEYYKEQEFKCVNRKINFYDL